jgi:D-xylose transport system permease protein
MTLLLRPEASDWAWWAAIGAAVAVTTVIGFLHSIIITKAGVPSFVVTLAGLLIWSGVVLILTTEYSTAGTIRIQDATVVGIANDFLPPLWGWLVGAAVVAGFGLSQLQTARSRRASDLLAKPALLTLLQTAGLALVTFAAIWYANRDRGVPTVILILLVVLVFWSFVAARTRFGRHVYAVGGSAEAARRAGINVDRVRIAVFMISGLMAGLGGIMFASRLRSVATNTGGGNLLLNVIAAAVIGGANLMGGVGTALGAVVGAALIEVIRNSLILLGISTFWQGTFVGTFIIIAVLFDRIRARRAND